MNRDTLSHVGETVTICGWVNTRRDMGKIVFLDMRDRSGILQVVLVPQELSDASQKIVDSLRQEFCLRVTGEMKQRDAKQVNPKLDTGNVELLAREVEIFNPSKTPPLDLADTSNVNEEARLTYRYLDLRTERMRRNLELRHRVVKYIRDWLSERGFLEIETPLLTKGTPEGAREFIVPSRLHPGKFYVLPQSPQQFKQLLMVAGVEKYFQIARALRDEDQRGDRQPEHTQLDLEMSFVTQDDVLALTEALCIALVTTVTPEKTISTVPFPRITWEEAMKKYQTDKPDLRKNKNNPNELAFAWIIDFPMFEQTEDGSVQPAHHPFCAIKELELLDTDPMAAHAQQYDLVLNGYELASGSIRIHDRALQHKIFKLLKLSEADIEQRFGHMLRAFEYGAPPHGGIAPGIDRLVMVLAGEPNIREVIAFPKTGDARDLLMGAPSEIEQKRLDEAHISIKGHRK